VNDGAAGPIHPSTHLRRLALTGPVLGTVGRCRDFTWQALVDWQWLPAFDAAGQAAAEDVLLVVSELVANACLHAGGPHELALHCDADRLRIEVADGSSRPPVRRPAGPPSAPGGHGLRVVDRLARAWGTAPDDQGKRVWAEISAPASPRGG
jgi:hypothetical protein